MSIRALAEADLAITLEGLDFGWPVTLTDPTGKESVNLTAQTNDISQIVDPETGVAISGRQAAAVLRISTLYAQGFTLPVGVPGRTATPWLLRFDDINGLPHTFKIEAGDPDRTLGTISVMLGVWNA